MQHYIIHRKRSPGWHLLPPRFNDWGPLALLAFCPPPPPETRHPYHILLKGGSEVASSTFPESRQLVTPPIQRGEPPLPEAAWTNNDALMSETIAVPE